MNHESLLAVGSDKYGNIIFHIQDNKGKKHEISSGLPPITKNMRKKLETDRSCVVYWKKIHSIAELLNLHYGQLFSYMSLYRQAMEMEKQTEAENKKQEAVAYWKCCRSIVQNLLEKDLKEIRRYPHVYRTDILCVLRKFSYCNDAITQSFSVPMGNSEFHNSILLTERLKDLSYHALHLADELLQHYFDFHFNINHKTDTKT